MHLRKSNFFHTGDQPPYDACPTAPLPETFSVCICIHWRQILRRLRRQEITFCFSYATTQLRFRIDTRRTQFMKHTGSEKDSSWTSYNQAIKHVKPGDRLWPPFYPFFSVSISLFVRHSPFLTSCLGTISTTLALLVQ